jgi:hypothetical protein
MFASVFTKEKASVYFVNKSVNIIMYEFPAIDVDNGPLYQCLLSFMDR